MMKFFSLFYLIFVSFNVAAQGVGKHGQASGVLSTLISKNGRINTANYINRNGKIIALNSSDGLLNYQIFTTNGGPSPRNENSFKSFTKPGDQTSSGTQSGNLLLDWSTSATLISAGISIPNGGDSFSVVVTGTFIPEESGIYTFTCEGDDAVDLFISDVNVANHYDAHAIYSLGSNTGTISLVAGTGYSFRARMQENSSGEGLRVFWRKPSQSSGWYINTTELSSVTQ